MSKELTFEERLKEYYLVDGFVFYWPGYGDGVYPLIEEVVDKDTGRIVVRQATKIPSGEQAYGKRIEITRMD